MANRSLTPILPWDQATDSQYTWVSDSSICNILPTGKTMAYDEVTGYFPVTAHSLSDIEVRASGNVDFSCTLRVEDDQSYNSHSLYVNTEENDGNSQLVSKIKIVGYIGSTAYSASTILTKNPQTVAKNIYITPQSTSVTSADTSVTINVIAENCQFSYLTVTGTGGNWSNPPEPVANGNQITFTFSPNTGPGRTATYSMYLWSTDPGYNNRYGAFFILGQAEAGEPEPTPPDTGDTGDTGYTWYEDPEILNILPTARTLTANETRAYYPVTAYGLSDLSVRKVSGDAEFTYVLEDLHRDPPEYNSHALYLTLPQNTGNARLESEVAVVGYSGDSGYSATTYLFQNAPTDGWVTASPNPVNAPSLASQTDVYLTLTNCSRSVEDELTGNSQLAEWVTVQRLNDTVINFSFAANTTGSRRSTYYMAYGRDSVNRLVSGRIDINQSAEQMGITITPSRSVLSKEAGSFTAAINSTEDGPFTFSAASWMVISNYSATSNHSGTLFIDYYANGNNWDRTGDIKAFQQISVSPYTLSASTTISQLVTSGDGATLTVTPETAVVNRHSGSTSFEVSYTGLASVPGVTEGEGNMNITSFAYANGELVVVYGENEAATDKTKIFIITAATSNGTVISREVRIRQTGTGLPVAPVWRDYVLDLPANGRRYINYSINFDGETVYTGRAYVYPGAENITIYFNQLVKNFLSNYINFESGYQTVGNWLGNFTITSPELGDITSVAFYEDYSYENRIAQNIMTLNNPITNEVPEGGLVPLSFFVTGETGTVQIRTNKRIN